MNELTIPDENRLAECEAIIDSVMSTLVANGKVTAVHVEATVKTFWVPAPNPV